MHDQSNWPGPRVNAIPSMSDISNLASDKAWKMAPGYNSIKQINYDVNSSTWITLTEDLPNVSWNWINSTDHDNQKKKSTPPDAMQ